MDTLVLEESSVAGNLFPFTWTRPVIDIRIGILTLREKWERLLPAGTSIRLLPDAKAGLYAAAPDGPTAPDDPITPAFPANILPSAALIDMIRHEQDMTSLTGGSGMGLTSETIGRIMPHTRRIHYPWDIFQLNGLAMAEDFILLTKGRRSAPIPASVQAIAPENIFIEEGARIHHATLNASTGPIYIGRNTEIMEGSLIRGPFALCEGATVKMGTKIYGATTIGPCSIVGGEIKNSVIFGYSNKGHDGYLGDAVIGAWCNLGAGTSNSNLKNNAGEIKIWHPGLGQAIPAGMKCGLLMGDYSRSAINTSFNTGTVTGICCNIFGAGLTPKYIPSFSWGQSGDTRYEWDKCLRDIANWKKLKNQSLADGEIQTLKHIFDRP